MNKLNIKTLVERKWYFYGQTYKFVFASLDTVYFECTEETHTLSLPLEEVLADLDKLS